MSKKFWPSIAMAMTAAMTRFTLGAGAVASSVADDVRGIRGVRPAMRARLARKFKRPDRWDFREYAGDGFGWFQSRQTGVWRMHKIAVSRASAHVTILYQLDEKA